MSQWMVGLSEYSKAVWSIPVLYLTNIQFTYCWDFMVIISSSIGTVVSSQIASSQHPPSGTSGTPLTNASFAVLDKDCKFFWRLSLQMTQIVKTLKHSRWNECQQPSKSFQGRSDVTLQDGLSHFFLKSGCGWKLYPRGRM